MSCSWCMPWITEPAPRNSSALKKACVNRWNIAALIGADARREEHVAQLRTGRIGDHPLDVVLGQADRGGEQGRDRADNGDDSAAPGACIHRAATAADHEDAGGDHGRRVDQGRHRRRAFHRVRQPGVQEELGRLAHRADEQQQQTSQVQRDHCSRGTPTVVRPWRRSAGTARDRTVPNIQKTVMMPSAKPKSPTRLTTKALMAAALAVASCTRSRSADRTPGPRLPSRRTSA
jgi:hypothetical protein